MIIWFIVAWLIWGALLLICQLSISIPIGKGMVVGTYWSAEDNSPSSIHFYTQVCPQDGWNPLSTGGSRGEPSLPNILLPNHVERKAGLPVIRHRRLVGWGCIAEGQAVPSWDRRGDLQNSSHVLVSILILKGRRRRRWWCANSLCELRGLSWKL